MSSEEFNDVKEEISDKFKGYDSLEDFDRDFFDPDIGPLVL